MPTTENSLLLQWIEKTAPLIDFASLGRRIGRNNYKKLELYMFFWFALEIVILILSDFIRFNIFVEICVFILFSYRLFEILITSFNSVFLSVLEGKRSGPIARLFLTVQFNYIEVMAIFSLFFFLLLSDVSLVKSINYSVSLATLSGTTFDEKVTGLYIAGIAEMLFGIFFVTGIIAALVNYLGAREGKK